MLCGSYVSINDCDLKKQADKILYGGAKCHSMLTNLLHNLENALHVLCHTGCAKKKCTMKLKINKIFIPSFCIKKNYLVC